MSSSPHPLSSLLGPLRYAAARGFANLRAVRDLRTPLGAALTRAAGELSGSRRRTLEEALVEIDSPLDDARRRAVLKVLAVLRDEGLTVEFVEPRLLAEGGAQPASSVPPLASASAPRVAGARVVERPSEEGRAPGARGEARRAKRSPEDGEGETPTKLLSIAPARGPLAMTLREAGLKASPRLVGLLTKRGLLKTGDILFLVPRAYEDRRVLKRIAELRSGERGTVVVQVVRVEERAVRGRRGFRAVLADASGSLAATYFQGGAWLRAKFPLGVRLVVSGEVRQSPSGWEMPHPEVEPAEELERSPEHVRRIVPVYSGFERGEQRALRALAQRVVERYAGTIEEPLPETLRQRHRLLGLGEALARLHFPPDDASMDALNQRRSEAHRRLAFDELFFLQLGLALRRSGVKADPGVPFDVGGGRLERALALLPFAVTGAQRRAIEQLLADLSRPEAMHRLLQGDVGSGKTAVALVAAAVAVLDGHQVAVMAPTEVLAEQHHRTFSRLLAPLEVAVGLLTGSATAGQRAAQRRAVAEGRLQVVVGTHALIQAEVEFRSLGLAIIDEQHRFGVLQRHTLMSKGRRAHVLVMTATPIPRTLAMTLYGDLDVSVLDELPPGRTPIETRVYQEKARPAVWERVRGELGKGHQAYVVYPLVEESEKVDLADATQGLLQLQAVFPEARVGLLHGRMKPHEKEQVMGAFRRHELDLLVATTVVEVGVDVPNASVMLIEHAERFGLSQLHQLRGRVGRGAARSFCFLIAGHAKSQESRERLEVMEQTSDGFVVAEKDLELRGPGELLGTRQSGLPELVVANLARDQALLAVAREEARAIVGQDPSLSAPEHGQLVRALEERWEGRLKLARVG